MTKRDRESERKQESNGRDGMREKYNKAERKRQNVKLGTNV